MQLQGRVLPPPIIEYQRTHPAAVRMPAGERMPDGRVAIGGVGSEGWDWRMAAAGTMEEASNGHPRPTRSSRREKGAWSGILETRRSLGAQGTVVYGSSTVV